MREGEVPAVGAKASTIWYVDAPDPATTLRNHREPDQHAAHALASHLYPESVVVPLAVGPLSTSAGIGGNGVYIGCYPGLTVVCGPQLEIAHPAKISPSWIRPLASEYTYLVSIDPVREWGAFATWERGELRRSFSATKTNILEDHGLPLVWERPFWAGEHPMEHTPGVIPDPQSLPFDPQDFADAANERALGFRYRGTPQQGALDPAGIVVCGFALYGEGEEIPRAPVAAMSQPVEAVPAEAGFFKKWRRKQRR
ncbi:DUF6928 family protein [Antrihabitans spumae]|uniref:DUF6928 family protein n=1 Tax=Antrihabitans spumae TaxID=3373370 RepID=A0ABW7KB10_9NOCA